MLHKIVDELIDNLSFSFQGTLAGIAVPVKKTIADGEKTFPVYYKDSLSDCETDNLQQLVPDDTKKSIIYFEVINQPTVKQHHKAFNSFIGKIRLVCWANLKKISPDLHDMGVIASNILDGFPSELDNIEFISSIRLFFDAQIDKASLFDKYTYNEAETQFMTYPYDAIGLNFDIEFRIAKGCATPIVIESSC